MIRGTERNIPESKNFNIDVNIHNRFDIEVIDSVTKKIKQKSVAYNVIVNNMWGELHKSYISDTYGWFYKITYGRGTGTPSADDTDLFSTIGTINAVSPQYGYDYKNACCWVRKSVRVDELTSNGETITEMGIRSPNNVLCTHAMLRDMNGNQISIQKGNTDILNIYATVYVHIPKEYLRVDNPIQVNLKGITETNYQFSFLQWLMGCVDRQYNSNIGPCMFRTAKGRLPQRAHDFSASNSATFVFATKTNDTANKTYTFSGRLPADKGNNVGGIGWWICSSSYRSAYHYIANQLAIKAIPPIFNGSHIQSEAVGTGNGTTADFCTVFDYPKNAIIYVDGVVSSNVIVEDVPKYNTRMGQYLECVDVVDGEVYTCFDDLYNGNYGDYPIGGSNTDKVYIQGTRIFYNPNYRYGISSFYSYLYYNSSKYCSGIYVSDDLVTWNSITSGSIPNDTINVPEEYRYKKYWKFEMVDVSSETYISKVTATDLTGMNIHFETPPAEGSVITIDYDTPVIAKDENHVFDLSITLHLGEYVEE